MHEHSIIDENTRLSLSLDWSLPGRNMGGGPPPLMGLPNRVC